MKVRKKSRKEGREEERTTTIKIPMANILMKRRDELLRNSYLVELKRTEGKKLKCDEHEVFLNLSGYQGCWEIFTCRNRKCQKVCGHRQRQRSGMQEAMDWTVDSGLHVCVRGCACWRHCWSRAGFLSLSVPSSF